MNGVCTPAFFLHSLKKTMIPRIVRMVYPAIQPSEISLKSAQWFSGAGYAATS